MRVLGVFPWGGIQLVHLVLVTVYAIQCKCGWGLSFKKIIEIAEVSVRVQNHPNTGDAKWYSLFSLYLLTVTMYTHPVPVCTFIINRLRSINLAQAHILSGRWGWGICTYICPKFLWPQFLLCINISGTTLCVRVIELKHVFKKTAREVPKAHRELG